MPKHTIYEIMSNPELLLLYPQDTYIYDNKVYFMCPFKTYPNGFNGNTYEVKIEGNGTIYSNNIWSINCSDEVRGKIKQKALRMVEL